MTFFDAFGTVLSHIFSPLTVAFLMCIAIFGTVVATLVAIAEATTWDVELWHVIVWITAAPAVLIAITMIVWITSFPDVGTWP